MKGAEEKMMNTMGTRVAENVVLLPHLKKIARLASCTVTCEPAYLKELIKAPIDVRVAITLRMENERRGYPRRWNGIKFSKAY